MNYNANHYDARANEDIVDVLTAISVEETGEQSDRRTPAKQINGRRKIK